MKISGLIIFIILGLIGRSARATLGEGPASIDTDAAKLNSTKKAVIQKQNYSIHQLTAKGSKVTEYVSNDGVVFAVAWKTTTRPKLSLLLGSYFSEFRNAVLNTPRQMGRRYRK